MSSDFTPVSLVRKMSLAERVGQIFVFTWLNPVQARSDLQLHPGGFIRIYSDALTVARESAQVQRESRIPLIIAADLERGIGGTIQGGIEVVSAMAIGATGDEAAAFDAARMIGEEALAMGINMNYAPVLDVNSSPLNPVINTRSFGADPDLVARLGASMVRGFHAAGVAACGKHFPGHGDTHVDSHTNLGTVDCAAEQLRAVELGPFRAAIAAGVDAIMSAHLLVPCIDPEGVPATLSRKVMTGLLRDELGFEGVAVTDALDMGAIAKNFPPEISVPMAVNAGCDQLIMPSNNDLVVDILTAAVKRGEVSEERLNEAVVRLLTLKERRGILNVEQPKTQVCLTDQLNRDDHQSRVRDIAEISIARVSGSEVGVGAGSRIFYLEVGTAQAERSYYLEPRSFGDYLAEGGIHVVRRRVSLAEPTSDRGMWERRLAEMKAEIAACDVVVVGTFASIRLNSGTVGLPPDIVKGIRGLIGVDQKQEPGAISAGRKMSQGRARIIASFGSPYVTQDFRGAEMILCAFSETQASQRAMARAIRGEISCVGVAPVNLG